MKIKSAFLLAVIITIISCNQNKKNPITTTDTEQPKIDSFFPLTSFLKGQMALIDSTPITPLHYSITKEKTDSVWMKKEELKSFLSPFFSPEITATNLTGFYQKSSFNDLSINSLTYTHDPTKALPDSLNLLHWDIYVNPETEKITRVYMVKSLKLADKTYTQQLTWQVDKFAKIVLIDPEAKTGFVKEDKFVWSF
ncbi:hypothetical protein ACQ33O_05475 [Ferruginibacter sp. SUN002]|uniref:hypothetical protein n=1 Tax=Ferruginibacter sp. SUN002 TaxID=2937789 RepID=UPI003D36333E